MPARAIIDASVLLASLLPDEPTHPEAQKLLGLALLAPAQTTTRVPGPDIQADSRTHSEAKSRVYVWPPQRSIYPFTGSEPAFDPEGSIPSANSTPLRGPEFQTPSLRYRRSSLMARQVRNPSVMPLAWKKQTPLWSPFPVSSCLGNDQEAHFFQLTTLRRTPYVPKHRPRSRRSRRQDPIHHRHP